MASEAIYTSERLRMATGARDYEADDVRCLVLEATQEGGVAGDADDPDLLDVAELLALAGVTEVVGSTRQAVGTISATQDDTNDRVNVDADATPMVTFPAVASKSAVAVVFYDEGGGTDGTRLLISYHSTGFGAGQPMDGGLDINTPNDWVRIP